VKISTSKLSEEEKKTRKRERDRRRYAENRERIIAQNKAYGQRNIHKRKGYALKSRYGITQDEWDARFAAQGFVCAICGSADPNDHRTWHTDHDHNSGEVRGILCARCNHLLGHERDSQDILSKAIQYLN
jgi:hypothetical protein